jgi:transposase InsO family protein
MAKSTYHYYCQKAKIPDKYREKKELIHKIFEDNRGRYGYRRITLEMRRQGYLINHKTVLKLMNQCGLKCMVRKKKYHSYKGSIGKIAPNVLQRDFSTVALNKKWATDISEFNLLGQKRYFSPIMDLYNQEIVSFTISDSLNLAMVTQMLNKAFENLPKNVNLIIHSGQGWHYQHLTYQKIL